MNIVVIEWPYPYRASTGNVAIIETIERFDIFGTLKDAYKGFVFAGRRIFIYLFTWNVAGKIGSLGSWDDPLVKNCMSWSQSF